MSLLFVSAFANAEIRSEVSMSKVNYDGSKLEVGYTIGGGCSKHEPAIDVTFTKVGIYDAEASVKVFDVSDKPDFCEAIIYREASIELSKKIKELAAEQGIQVYRVNVQLPKVQTFAD
jgi:hypothetical protein